MTEFDGGIYDLNELLQDESFCDYIQICADRSGRTYNDVYDDVLDNPTFTSLVIDGFYKLTIETQCKLYGTVNYYDSVVELLKFKQSTKSVKHILYCLDYVKELERIGYNYHV